MSLVEKPEDLPRGGLFLYFHDNFLRLPAYICPKIGRYMKYGPILLMISLFLLPQCNSVEQSANQQQAAWDEMMVIHDEVMPRLKDIADLSRTLSTARSESKIPENLLAEAEQINQQLLDADKAMWDWMYALKQLPDLRQQSGHAEIMAYLEAEKNNISEVREAMLSSIAAAEKFIATINTTK
jgi:hypothetical protein